jgi:phosphatidate cytidylyltransferase
VKRVLTAVILIPIVVLALFRAPLWLFAVLVLTVALLAAREYFDIAEATGFRPMRGWGYIALAAIFVATAASIQREDTSGGHLTWIASAVFAGLLFMWPYVLAALSMMREPLSQSLGDASVSFLMVPYVGLTLLLLLILRELQFGALFLLYLMLVVWSGDVAAYYVGRAVGKHKLAARVSPGKTWEGAAASAAGAIVVGLVLFHYSRFFFRELAAIGLYHDNVIQNLGNPDGPDVHQWLSHPPAVLVIAFALCTNVAAQLGDLFESAIKRGAGVKDSGSLLPGHGGVLDRIDALLFALPVGFFFYRIMAIR